MPLSPPQPKQNAAALAKILRVVGDVRRLTILCIIFDREKICVSDIATRLKISIASVSHHVRALARVGLLEPVREGKEVCYLFHDVGLAKDLKKFIRHYKK